MRFRCAPAPSSPGSSKSFEKDVRGAAAVTFAIALVPVLIVIGAAIDYSRWRSQHAQLRAAADSAALPGANPSTPL